MSKSAKRPMKSYFKAKNAAAYRRQRNREYTAQHEEALQESREKQFAKEKEGWKKNR